MYRDRNELERRASNLELLASWIKDEKDNLLADFLTTSLIIAGTWS
jgi:hypothetical protein